MAIWPSLCGMNQAKSHVKLERNFHQDFRSQIYSPNYSPLLPWPQGVNWGDGNGTWKTTNKAPLSIFYLLFWFLSSFFTLKFHVVQHMNLQKSWKGMPPSQPASSRNIEDQLKVTLQIEDHKKQHLFARYDNAEGRDNLASYRIRGNGTIAYFWNIYSWIIDAYLMNQ